MIEELFKVYLKRFGLRYMKPISYEAVVISVNEVNETCVVQAEDAPELSGVKLKSIIGNTTTKLILVPKVNSYVIVSLLNNMETEAYVAQVSEVEKIITDCEQVVYNNGEKGGLLNWPDAKEQLEKTNAVLQDVVNSMKNWVPVPNDGGNALKVFFNAQLGIKTVGDYNNLEDTRVKH